jgi:DNA-binding NarL/FixJ family response regulator
MPELGPITVYLVAESRVLREGLLRLLRKHTDLAVVGNSDSPQTAASEISSNPCDVLLIDSLPSLHAISLSGPSVSLPEGSKLRIVLFGMEEDYKDFLKAVQAGVTAYLLSNAAASDLIGAIRSVVQGEAVCPPRLCFALLKAVVKRSILLRGFSATEDKFGLTQRQQELVELLSQRLSNKEIAAKLNIAESTVKNHVQRIMRQLEAKNRHEAAEITQGSSSLIPRRISQLN